MADALSIAALLLMNEVLVPTGEPRLINAFYLAWTVPLAGAMILSLFEPERYEALRRRLGSGLRVTAFPTTRRSA